jgi:hypothetical protein
VEFDSKSRGLYDDLKLFAFNKLMCLLSDFSV